MSTDPLFKDTDRVVLELSNICNLAYCHKQCPASLVKPEERRVLPAQIARHVIETLGRFDYSGYITFYGYSEPLTDPRLQTLIEHAKAACPNSKPSVTTNGFMLTDEMLADLTVAGLAYVRVSAYGKPEYDRLMKVKAKAKIPVSVRLMGGDKWRHRIEDYEAKKTGFKEPCFSPLIDIRVLVDGRVGLCCVDYKNLYTFGDLNKESFEDIMRSGRLQTLTEEHRAGIRTLDLCQRCGVARKHGYI
ncbi:MAG: SPASM domain-containing protein [Acidobacteria bacterium]|nr:SPASM domain-containing protein [Acidobacteriota bacterium]